MDVIYNFCIAAIILIPLGILVGLIRPRLFSGKSREPIPRLRIVKKGMIAFVLVFIVAMITQPASVRQSQQASPADSKTTPQTSEQATAAAAQKESVITTKEISEVETVPYADTEKADSSLPKGERKMIQDGKAGEKTIIYTVRYKDGKESDRTLKSSSITKQPVQKVIAVGTYEAPRPQPTPQPAATSSASTSAYYKNCTAARAAGAAPVYRGDPGYGSHLDRDGDGIGCE